MLRYINVSYIAGFFDGEGCISIGERGLRVIFTNTRKDVLDKIHEYFKSKFGESFKFKGTTTKARTGREKFSLNCYQLVYWERHAEKVLKELETYLFIKRKEAKIALKYMTTRGKQGIKVSDKILKIRLSLMNACKMAKLDNRTQYGTK